MEADNPAVQVPPKGGATHIRRKYGSSGEGPIWSVHFVVKPCR
jgi:hypothetical protein